MKNSLRRPAIALVMAAAALVASAQPGVAKAPKPPAGGLATTYTYELPNRVTSRFHAPLVTEAPDGVIYFAHVDTVYRVEDQSTRVVQQVHDRVYALAASSTLLVVETPTDVYAYSRYTGKRVADWNVEQTGAYPPALSVVGDIVWSLTDQSISPASLAPATLELLRVGHQPRIITDQATPTTPVVDASGNVFLVRFGGRIERVTPSGATQTSADKTFAAATLAYIDGVLIAEIDSAHTVVDEVDPTSLSVISSHGGTAGDYYGLAATSIGGLSLSADCGASPYCSKTVVRRITPPDTRGPALSVPYGAAVLGPQATVLEVPAGAMPQLVGLRLA